MNNKNGFAKSNATVLIILITVAAIAIIVSIIMPIIEDKFSDRYGIETFKITKKICYEDICTNEKQDSIEILEFYILPDDINTRFSMQEISQTCKEMEGVLNTEDNGVLLCFSNMTSSSLTIDWLDTKCECNYICEQTNCDNCPEYSCKNYIVEVL